MSTVWRNLELIEETYEQIFLKTHRIQANRVCLGDLTGVDFRGEKHPVNCPCEKRAAKERLDKERLERRRLEEEEKKRQQELTIKRLEKQKKLDQQIESKKKEFYKKMNGSESSRNQSQVDSRSKYDVLKAKTSKIIDHFPDLRSGRSSLVIIDGELKSLTSEFIEQDGMLIQEQSICSLDLAEVDLDDDAKEKEIKTEVAEEIPEEPEDTGDVAEDDNNEPISTTNIVQKKPEKSFERFLDIMEIF